MHSPPNPDPAAPAGAVSLAPLPLWAGLLPLVVVHLCYVLSATAGLIPQCVPYLEGCTSVSSSGRYGAAYFLFKAGMLPAAVLIGAFWWASRHWLLGLGDDDGPALKALVWTGIVAAVFLILYSVFLGSRGDFYNLMRRFGVTVYFGASYLAQLILLSRLARLRRAGRLSLPGWIVPALLGLAIALILVGLAGIPVTHLVPEDIRPGKHRLQNTIEWNFCLLLVASYGIYWWAWRRSGFTASFGTKQGGAASG